MSREVAAMMVEQKKCSVSWLLAEDCLLKFSLSEAVLAFPCIEKRETWRTDISNSGAVCSGVGN